MKKVIKMIMAVVLAAAFAMPVAAQSIVKKKLRPFNADSIEHVVIQGDTTLIVIPEHNFGRYDRGLFNYIFIPKGKWSFGLTASYGELSTEDIQVLSILKDVDISGKMYSIKPYLSYFIRHNMAVGLKFNYTRGIADLNNLSLDLNEDLNFSLHDVSYYQQSLSVSTFYRNYVGLDRGGRFAVFNEVDLSFGTGSSRFKRLYNNVPRDTRTIVTQGALNFSPGVCVFLQDYVSFNLSFGVFGLNWRKEDQTTDGVPDGSRVTSGANFRFNIFNINFGLMVVI